MNVLVVHCAQAQEPPLDIPQLRQAHPQIHLEVVSERQTFKQALSATHWDLILCGYAMGWINGFEVLSQAQQRRPPVPVVMVTACGNEETAVQGMRGGLLDYLTPATVRRLDDYLRTAPPLPLERGDVEGSTPPKPAPQAGENIPDFVAALQSAPGDLILVFDLEGRVRFANQTFLQRSGYRLDEVIGRDLRHLMPLPLAEERLKLLRQVVESGQPLRQETRGVEGWLDISLFPLRDEVGQVRMVGTVARDITERKEMEAQLYQSHQVIQTLLDNPFDVIHLLDRDGRILHINRTSGDLVGKTPQELTGTIVWDYMPPHSAEMRRTYLEEVFRTGQVKRFEEHGVHGIFDSVLIPVFNQEGEVVQVAVMARNITALKQAELTARQNEALLRAATELAPLIVFHANAQGRLQFVEGRGILQSGYADKLDGEVNLFNLAADRPEFLDVLRRVLAGEEVQRQYEARSGRVYQVYVAPQRDLEGKISGLRGVAVDVTELKRAQEVLQNAYAEVAAQVAARTAELQEANQALQIEVKRRARAEEQMRHHANRALALAKFIARLNTDLDLNAVLRTTGQQLGQLLPNFTFAIWLREGEKPLFRLTAVQGEEVEALGEAATLSYEHCENLLCHGDVALWRKGYPNPCSEPGGGRLPPPFAQLNSSIMALALRYKGDLIGLLGVFSPDSRLPKGSESALLRGMAAQAAVAIANARLFQQVAESRARLQELSEQLILSQEQERRRIAAELHDEIGQMFTSLSLSLEALQRELGQAVVKDGHRLHQRLQAARKGLTHLLEQVRSLSLDLRPAALDDLGLVPALTTFIERFSAQSGIRVLFNHHGLPQRLPPTMEIAVFRLVQEALTNVVRHAKVGEARVHLWSDGRLLIVQVEDEGLGFDPEEKLSTRRSNGLAVMRERVALCGGRLEIESQRWRGTLITAEFPIPQEQPLG